MHTMIMMPMTMPGMKPAAKDEPEKLWLTVTAPVESEELTPMAAGAGVEVASEVAVVTAADDAEVVGVDVVPEGLLGTAMVVLEVLLRPEDEAAKTWHAPLRHCAPAGQHPLPQEFSCMVGSEW